MSHGADSIPVDWAHTLDALYRVRCNLFHGQKSGGGHEDREILSAAVAVLLPLTDGLLLMRGDGQPPSRDLPFT